MAPVTRLRKSARMTRFVRWFVSAVLCVILVLTGHSMAMVRGASAATGQMVICVGDTTTVIYTDAEGEPTAAPHICPECIVTWHAATPPIYLGGEAVVSTIPWKHPLEWLPLRPWIHASFDARGPPDFS